jgi:ribosomal protein L27
VRQDTSGDRFCIELDGQKHDNRGVAGELIVRRAAKIRNNFGANPRIGKFAGFDLFLYAHMSGEVEFSVHGKNHYGARVTETALGTIRSLESLVQGFEERAVSLERDITDFQKKAKELQGKVGVPFEHESRYHELVQRQGDIEEKLDLTKNQAPSQVDEASDGEIEVKVSNQQKHTATNSLKRQRRVSV